MADVGKDLGNSADPKNIQDLTTFVSLSLLFVLNSINEWFSNYVTKQLILSRRDVILAFPEPCKL